MPPKVIRRGRRRRSEFSGGRGSQSIVVPFIATVPVGQTIGFSFSQLFVGKQITGVPWRLRSVRIQASLGQKAGTYDPAVLQIRLNSALASNVESIASARLLVTHVPTVRVVRMKNPNPWKEDEERDQQVISFDNVPVAGSTPSKITILAHARFQLGALIFDTPSTWTAEHPGAGVAGGSQGVVPLGDPLVELPSDSDPDD